MFVCVRKMSEDGKSERKSSAERNSEWKMNKEFVCVKSKQYINRMLDPFKAVTKKKTSQIIAKLYKSGVCVCFGVFAPHWSTEKDKEDKRIDRE